MRATSSNILVTFLLLLTLYSISPWSKIPLGNTTFWWIIQAIVLVSAWNTRDRRKKALQGALPLRLFLVWVLCSFVYGTVMAEHYWDWKLLIQNLMVFCLPLVVFSMSEKELLSKFLTNWLRYALPLFPIFYFLTGPDAYGRYLAPVGFLYILFPFLTKKWKTICLIFIILLITYGAISRSNMIKSLVPFCISLTYLILKKIKLEKVKRSFSKVRLIVLGFPLIFLFLGIYGKFNVFNFEAYLTLSDQVKIKTNNVGDEYSILDDTRTFLYVDQLKSAIKNDYIVFGRSMARGYDTKTFAWLYEDFRRDTKRNERQSCEVSILNIFNYFGLIGVVLYFLIFISATRNAILKSNSRIMCLVGMYLSFRWCYAWVEDFNKFDLDYLTLWLFISMCMSKDFLRMTDQEFKEWITKSTVSKRYLQPFIRPRNNTNSLRTNTL